MPSLLDFDPRAFNPRRDAALRMQKEQDDKDARAALELEHANTALARERHLARNDADEALGKTMRADINAWVQTPGEPKPSGTETFPYQSDFAHAPAEAKEHFGLDIYGNASADAPGAWNQAVMEHTGAIPGLENFPAGSHISAKPTPGVQIGFDKGGNRVLKSQVARAGITDLPGDATDDEMQAAIAGSVADKAQKAEDLRQRTIDLATRRQDDRVIREAKQMAQTNRQAIYYQAVAANYGNIEKILAKPQRTGADDSFLLQSAGTMEAPGRSPTGHDVKTFLQANGIKGNLDVLVSRWEALVNQSPEAQAKAGRLLSDQLVHDIAAAAKNSLESRKEQAVEAMAPHVARLEDIGQDPYRHLPKGIVDAVKAREATLEGVAVPPTAPSSDFITGKKYKDANGNTATYRGDGKWE